MTPLAFTINADPSLRAHTLDSALQWYHRIIQEHGSISYEDLEAGLREMFLPHNHQELLRGKLDSVKQRGRLDEYINEFMNVMNQITEMSELDKVHAFKRGLAYKTKAEVGYLAPKTLKSAIEMAQGFDSNFFGNMGWTKNHARNESHFPMDINSSQTRSVSRIPKDRKEGKHCTYCHRRGHVQEECFKKKNVKENHSESSPNDEFIKITANVNKVPVLCLVDTGANQSILSPALARKYS